MRFIRIWGNPGKGRFWGIPPMQKTPVGVSGPGMDSQKADLPLGEPHGIVCVDYSEIELRILAQIEEQNLTSHAPDWVRRAIKEGKHKA